MAVFWPSCVGIHIFYPQTLARSSFDTILLAVLVRTISPISCARTLSPRVYNMTRMTPTCAYDMTRWYDEVRARYRDIDQSILRSHFVPCDILRSRHRTSCALPHSAVAICSALALRAWPWRLMMSLGAGS